jgi:transposase-like protein
MTPRSTRGRYPSARTWTERDIFSRGGLHRSSQHVWAKLKVESLRPGGGGLHRQGDHGRRLSAEERLEMLQRVAAGATFATVAAAMGCSTKSIQRLMGRTGGLAPRVQPPSPSRVSLAEREEISRGLRACSASTSRRGRISPARRNGISIPSRASSTDALDKPSAGGNHMRSSPRPLRRPLETARRFWDTFSRP